MSQSLYKFVHQERFPVFTTISLLLTIVVEMLIVYVARERNMGFAEIARIPILIGLMVFGAVLNSMAGAAADSRQEHRVAIEPAAIIVWFATALLIRLVR
jgi:hypothetical protein